MTTYFEPSLSLADSNDAESLEVNPSDRITLCLVGGTKIIRSGIRQLLIDYGLKICKIFEDQTELAAFISSSTRNQCDAIVLIVSGSGPFKELSSIRHILNNTTASIPLVVLTNEAHRGQIYTALQIGAKAYVNLDAEPEELLKAITKAASNKVYLSPAATELIVEDISSARHLSRGSANPAKVNLTRREDEIVQLVCEGFGSKEIAKCLHISVKTVENHRHNIYRKCEVDNIAALMRHAIRQGLVLI